MANQPTNIAQAITERARANPQQIAMYFPVRVRGHADDPQIDYQSMSFAELDRRSDIIASGLTKRGICQGLRTVLMVRPTPEFFLLMFALFKAGAVPVLVDPGIDKAALKSCLAHAQPQAFIGIGIAHLARKLLGWGKASIKQTILVGSPWARWLLAQESLTQLEAQHQNDSFAAPVTDADSLAAILFTSGSTGVPKGVEYRHRHFLAQIELLREAFAIQPGGVNMPTFPPFALFDPALGSTSVIPHMDPTKPARADPRILLNTIQKFNVDAMFGSPALLRNLANYCTSHHGEEIKQKVASLRTIMSAGAPVPPALVEQCKSFLPAHTKLYTPYGATEALPVSLVEGSELGAETKAKTAIGAGILIGRVLLANEVKIIEINDTAITDLSTARLCAPGVVGEIIVRGPSVTDQYFAAAEKNALAKINDGGVVWHRMGDVGYFDQETKLWYCGRKSHRVVSAHGTLFTEQVEGIFNACPDIYRSALVGVGLAPTQIPVLLFQFHTDRTWPPPKRVMAALRALALQFDITKHIQHFVLHTEDFPVDIRHNAKIGREKLQAQLQKAYQQDPTAFSRLHRVD